MDLEGIAYEPLGDGAVIVRFSNAPTPEISAAICAAATALDSTPRLVFREHIVGMTTVTMTFDPLERDYSDVVHEIEALVAGAERAMPTPSRELEVPVCYGGEFGPDLETVAEHARMDSVEVIERHSAPIYVVDMIGFMPGFPYLGGLDERLAIERRESPRTRVPAGSVGIAGSQSGIYPNASPGGWQIVGRTPLRLFEPRRKRPSLLEAGDRVRFIPISEDRFDELSDA